MKPMKRIKQRCLVSAAEEPKAHLSANKVPVLVYPVAKSASGPDRIMAGRIYTPKTHAASGKRGNQTLKQDSVSMPNTTDIQDVWQTYRDRNGLPDHKNPKSPHSFTKAESMSSTSRSSVATTHDEEARMRLTKCEDQIRVLTNKIGAVEKEVTGLRSSFEDTLQTKLDSTSKTMMSEFKDMMLTFSVAAQPLVHPGRTKDRERAGRSRSPQED